MLGSPRHLCLFLLLHFQATLSSPFNLSSSPSPTKFCFPRESFALLHFKNSLPVGEGGCYYPKKANSWKENRDCCSWDGVTCDTFTGHVIGLDLRSSCLSGTIHDNSSLFLLRHLQTLDLADNYFSGQIPDVFGNLSKLTELSLSNNTFSGHIPSSAFKLTRICSLDFSFNKLEGHIPSQVSGLSDLTVLDLSYNFLSGEIPLWLFILPSLYSLYLNNNKFTGPFPNIMFLNFNLTQLSLSSNNLSGMLTPHLLSNLKNLEIIDLSYNSHLSLTPHGNTNFTLPELREFRFSFCNLTQFPGFLRNAENLQVLELSNNKISGQISSREFGLWSKLSLLNLSHNFLTSFEQIPSRIPLQVLDLASNLLQGPPFDLPTDLVFFSASNNKLTGEIPSSFCNLSSIQCLILSNNSFGGTIPQCLGMDNSVLSFLDLGMNNLSGNIPQALAESSIRYLNLNGNRLVGPLPPSFVNCSELEVLDVGNNMINDTFPHWLASLPKLQVLILRANRFHGPIGNSNTRNPFDKLHVLDLSHNQFTGLLPARYLENFKSMMDWPYDNAEASYMRGNLYSNPYDRSGMQGLRICNPYNRQCRGIYQFPYYSIVQTVKGVNIKMERILTSFTAIDFSDNLFQGGMPEELGKLISLKLLNFSQNKLTGEIPSSLKNLTQLESLDLSLNKLTGKIPIQLAGLTFLAVLNLSCNSLVGRIPQGKQFNTFQNDSFIGNLGLCGLPLSKECGDKKAQQPSSPTIFLEKDDTLSWFDWKVFMMGYGCGLVIGFSIGFIVFATRRPRWFVRMVERQQSTKVRILNRRCRVRRNWRYCNNGKCEKECYIWGIFIEAQLLVLFRSSFHSVVL